MYLIIFDVVLSVSFVYSNFNVPFCRHFKLICLNTSCDVYLEIKINVVRVLLKPIRA